MTFLFVLVGAAVFAVLCKGVIKAHPGAFYALAIALDVLLVVGSFVRLPGALDDALFLLLHKCTLATALFAIVMCIGVFKRDGRVAQQLRPIRAELSIVAWLLSLAHMAVYLASYATRLSSGFAQANVAAALVVALALLYVHVMLMLLPSALRGGAAAQTSAAVYSVVFLGYAVARSARAVADRAGVTPLHKKTHPEGQEPPAA